MNISKPKTIKEAIQELQTFLESDLYSKFKPEILNGEIFTRTDSFKDEKEFIQYIEKHFNILNKQIKKIETETFK